MPAVTVCSRPSGLPTATTHSPTSSLSESPRRATTRFAGGFSSRTTATSVCASLPTTWAVYSLPSFIVTVTFVAPCTTWRLVMMSPLAPMMKPDPTPWAGPGLGMPPPP